MKVSELLKIFKNQGIKLVEHGKRHDVYQNPTTGERAQIPRHQSQELAAGTLNDILKRLGLK